MDSKSAEYIDQFENEDFVPLTTENDPSEENKKQSVLKFFIYFLIIIVLTGLALFLSLYKDYESVINALKHSDWRYLLIILGLVTLTYVIEAFTVFAFSRLYTTKYKYHQGLAAVMVGAFYSDITPGASGGQIMEAYTMKKQGMEVSTSASILIMSFIVYQICLIILGAVGLFFSNGLLISIATFDLDINGVIIPIPTILFTILGFLLNLIVILMLFMMSYSHKIHNFILHRGINFLAKLKLVKNPEEKRESLRIQVENFKIELRRLLSNIPIFILMILCWTVVLIIRFSIPFWAGLALDGYGYCLNSDGSLLIKSIVDSRGQSVGFAPVMSTGGPDIQSFWQGVFLSSYHQMATGLVPIPGAAGISEYFFSTIFSKYYISSYITTAAQIIWRFSTFHIVLLIAGVVAATYRSSPKNQVHHANRKSFVTLQYQTYAERKMTSETMYDASALSARAVQERLKALAKQENKLKESDEVKKKEKPKKIKPEKTKKVKKAKKRKHTDYDDWDEIQAGDEY